MRTSVPALVKSRSNSPRDHRLLTHIADQMGAPYAAVSRPLACQVIFFLLTWVACFGCGSQRPKTIPVEGTVTFGGAVPPAKGALYFTPIRVDAGYPRRPAIANFDPAEQGKYSVRSFQEGDGLVPGEYRVRVECWKEVPSARSRGLSYIGPGNEPPNLVVSASDRRKTYDVDVPLMQSDAPQK